MNIFTRLFGRRAKEQKLRRDLIKKLDGRAIKYVVERLPMQKDSGESIEEQTIGRKGALIIKDNKLLVFADGKVIFRASTDILEASELMSLVGVILTAPDIENENRIRTIVAYYTYYLK